MYHDRSTTGPAHRPDLPPPGVSGPGVSGPGVSGPLIPQSARTPDDVIVLRICAIVVGALVMLGAGLLSVLMYCLGGLWTDNVDDSNGPPIPIVVSPVVAAALGFAPAIATLYSRKTRTVAILSVASPVTFVVLMLCLFAVSLAR